MTTGGIDCIAHLTLAPGVFGGMDVSVPKQLMTLEDENTKPKGFRTKSRKMPVLSGLRYGIRTGNPRSSETRRRYRPYAKKRWMEPRRSEVLATGNRGKYRSLRADPFDIGS